MATLVTVGYKENNFKTIIRPECRVCLKQDGLLPIFGDESKPDISIEISTFGGVKLQENDDLPKFICEDCFKLLEGAILFRKLAKRSEALFRRRKKKNTIQVQSSSSMKMEKVEYEVTALVPVHSDNSEINNLNSDHEFYINQDNKIDFVSVDTAERACDEHEYHEIKDKNGNNDETLTKISNEVNKESQSCKYCNLNFRSPEDYEVHRTTVEHKRNYVMSFLPKKRTKSHSLQRKKTVNPKDETCEFCNRVFTKLHYPRHMLSEHKIKLETSRSPTKKECTICNKLFHPAALSNHIKRIHNTESSTIPKVKLECPICKKLFSKHFYPLHLQRHKEGDTRNYVCDQCGKKFFFKSSFFTHKLVHTNVLPHKCDYCPYRGRTKELLKTHVRTHTGDHPYKCTQCDTRCSTKSNLNSHVRRHRGPIDFICDACSRGFYSKILLERHISVAHYGVKNYICSACGAAFGYRHGLMCHLKAVHKRPKGEGKPKALYLQLKERGLLAPEQLEDI